MPDPASNLLNWKPVSRPGSVTLHGRTVTLEPLDAARHAAALWQLFRGHNHLWTWMGDGPYQCEEELRRAIAEKQSNPAAIYLAIAPVATGLVAGWAAWLRIEPAHGVIEVGNIVFAPALQHSVAATEAMYLMASHIFDGLGYRRYEWKCNAENLPSRRAAQRLGFTFEGIFRQHMVVKDRNRDTAWYAMLDSGWPACKRAFEAWLRPANFDSAGKQRHPLEYFRQ